MIRKLFLSLFMLGVLTAPQTFAQVTATHEMGDYNPGDTLQCYFTTYRYDTGAPTTLAGTPAIKVYKDGDATSEVTTGLTLNADFDSRTGSNEIDVVTSNAFYAAGHRYTIVITTGTVNTVSVVGFTPCTFTLQSAAPVNVGSSTHPILRLAQIYVKPTGTNTDNAAIYVDGTAGVNSGLTLLGGGNQSGLKVNGNGSAPGVAVEGGATAAGMTFQGGVTGGRGLVISSTGTGNEAVTFNTQGTGTGLSIGGVGAFPAVQIDGDLAEGILVNGGTNSAALSLRGDGTGKDLDAPNSVVGTTLRKNTAVAAFPFVMYSSTGAPTAGLTVTCARSIDGGAFAACATASSTGIANGAYKNDLAASDLNGATIILKFHAVAGARDTIIPIVTQP